MPQKEMRGEADRWKEKRAQEGRGRGGGKRTDRWREKDVGSHVISSCLAHPPGKQVGGGGRGHREGRMGEKGEGGTGRGKGTWGVMYCHHMQPTVAGKSGRGEGEDGQKRDRGESGKGQ